MLHNSIKQIELSDCLNLRRDILWPNGTLQDCIEEDDENATHYGYIKDQKVISCLSVFYRSPIRYQIRKFATKTDYQNRGIGSFLFHHILLELANKKIETIYLNARVTAIRFYEKFQFQPFDKEFSKKGVSFLPMELNLTQWNIKANKNTHDPLTLIK
ncbi:MULTISPECIES: GNAT family N-acetyltransferase [Commensalibacter]|uniref:N-acetyltransferase GCN5 n=2 Tax=Commensalibacter TaxID=1079922 RepID=W7DVJ6_9PROT|nr:MULTISPECIES: GNAT family N-acetyltransferase [Commensalibacter]EUK19070.1 N-acetyltransferase GCN5 [Commensalibacter papalotli (ex Servin-Garciduenas et al. 2014)]CAI3923077.1 Ribosomal protein S18 acetylase RimI and related acetyltransferases (RimI) (PDB:1GHE) [Commensalibacter papalotli (ex Botero et al. 2024)]CAI3928937.1 Ribosomal protein S18 acetylase RimI and related acetyltransferases (RimI) (PDB:1GHE) [Commensalibacter papalotli (ex Botero et al. 2024)]